MLVPGAWPELWCRACGAQLVRVMRGVLPGREIEVEPQAIG